MGTTVIGGMLGASALGIFFVPVMFCIVEKLSKPRSAQEIPAHILPLPSQSPGAGDD
jgi:hypothetical protein